MSWDDPMIETDRQREQERMWREEELYEEWTPLTEKQKASIRAYNAKVRERYESWKLQNRLRQKHAAGPADDGSAW